MSNDLKIGSFLYLVVLLSIVYRQPVQTEIIEFKGTGIIQNFDKNTFKYFNN
jgi:hypothetical protein